MPHWILQLRISLRSLRKRPAFAAIAVLTLALGIGANVAIFSVLRGVLLAPLDAPDAERIVRVWPQMPVSSEFFRHFETRATAFEAVALHGLGHVSLRGDGSRGDGRPEEVPAARVTPGYFRVFGATPELGRAFASGESDPGDDGVVILSHALWRQRFAADRNVLGKAIDVDGRQRLVIGVMPESYRPFDGRAELWLPLAIDTAAEEHWDMISYQLLGRLRPESTPQQARQELRAAIESYGEVRPGYLADREGRASVTTLHEVLTADVREPLWALFAAVGCVLLVACANVAHLLLARIAGRRREFALRGALGAGRGQLARQVLLESLLLSVLGAALGLLLADWIRALVVQQLPAQVRSSASSGLDWQVLGFACVAALVAALGCGLVPALRASRAPLGRHLAGARGSAEDGRQRLHRSLTALEAAVAVVLVLGAGLLSKNFASLLATDPGFDAAGLLTLTLQPELDGGGSQQELEARRNSWFQRVVERVEAMPGVESAAAINRLPLTEGDVGLAFRLADDDPQSGQRVVSVRLVSPGLTETLGVPLLRGRALLPSDRAETERVGLVNDSLARELWGERDPIAERLVFDGGEPWFTVVGVVGDVRQSRLDAAPRPQVYQPLAQSAWESRMALVVRTSGDPSDLAATVRQAVWDVDPNVPVAGVATMEQLIHRSLHDDRVLTALFACLAGLALVLATLGVFGVTSYVVSQRRHENGVRLALGATAGDVVATTLRRALLPVLTGLAVGLVAGRFVLVRLEEFLSAVEVFDPWIYAGVPLVLAAVATLAAWIPARRASRADPMTVLTAD